jgi:3'-5' exoribonuclease
MWNASQSAFNAMPDGGFLRLAGRVENYQDNLQFIIDRFWIIEDPKEVVLEHLLPYTDKDVPAMFAAVRKTLGSIRNRALAAIVNAFLDDEPLMERFRKAPAAMSFHHSFIGGLLEHTQNMLAVADAICPFYPGLNRDLLVTGVFLHDIAKVWELTYDAGFGYSDPGHLVGHVVKGAIWIEQKAQTASVKLGEPIPEPLVAVLQHLVLSHHGQPDFGAARLPSTPEALALHLIDNLDAKVTMSLAATRSAGQQSEGNFTEYQKALGVRLFRPDVAPPDEPAVEQPGTPGPATLSNPLFEVTQKR